MSSKTFPLGKSFAVATKALLVVCMLQNCSSKSVYQFAQEQGRQDCELQPIALQESCREQYEMSYAEYERLRNQEGLTEKR